jgi:hypothetical protein
MISKSKGAPVAAATTTVAAKPAVTVAAPVVAAKPAVAVTQAAAPAKTISIQKPAMAAPTMTMAAAKPAVAVAQAPAAATKSEWLMAVSGVVEGEALPPERVEASGLRPVGCDANRECVTSWPSAGGTHVPLNVRKGGGGVVHPRLHGTWRLRMPCHTHTLTRRVC